jgi:aspartate aminotransferase
MKKQGLDVIGFGAGEPDIDTPSNIKKSGIRAIEMGFTKYTAAAGMPELRSAIAEKLSRDNGLSYSPSQVIVCCGAKHALFNIFQAICDEGDEVIILSPYWVSYSEAVRLSGGVPVIVGAGMDTGFKVTPEQITQAVTDRTKALVINSPCNPTGAVYTRAEIEAIGQALLGTDLYIVSDEIYERLVYDGTAPTSIAAAVPGLKDRTFIVNGVSKTYSMTGWRIGYAAGPEEEIRAIASIQSHSASAPAHFAQVAAIEAIAGDQSSVQPMVDEFRRRRDCMVSRLNSMEGVQCPTPAGAFYVFPKVSDLYGRTLGGIVIQNSADFCAQMLETAKIALVPGSGFGADEFVRLSYAMSMDSIERGLDRMAEAIAQMK